MTRATSTNGYKISTLLAVCVQHLSSTHLWYAGTNEDVKLLIFWRQHSFYQLFGIYNDNVQDKEH